jgi:hypothetical protein
LEQYGLVFSLNAPLLAISGTPAGREDGSTLTRDRSRSAPLSQNRQLDEISESGRIFGSMEDARGQGATAFDFMSKMPLVARRGEK